MDEAAPVALEPRRLGRPAGSDSGETRRRIMDAAARLVAERGYPDATLKDIALAAGVTGAALYRYFPSKVELVAATVRQSTEAIIPRLSAASAGPAPFRTVFHALLDEALRCAQDHPYITRLYYAVEAQRSEPALAALVQEVLGEQHRLMLALVGRYRSAIDPGVSDEAAADALLALMRGLTEFSAEVSPERHAAALRAAALLVEGRLVAD